MNRKIHTSLCGTSTTEDAAMVINATEPANVVVLETLNTICTTVSKTFDIADGNIRVPTTTNNI